MERRGEERGEEGFTHNAHPLTWTLEIIQEGTDTRTNQQGPEGDSKVV